MHGTSDTALDNDYCMTIIAALISIFILLSFWSLYNFICIISIGFFRLQVDVTQEGDVLFEVTVPEHLIEPVRLQINYTDIGNPVTPYHIINTASAYLGNVSFLHREYCSQVPFDDFRVGVRLLPHGKLTDTIIGPLVQDPVDYGELLLCISNFPGPIPVQLSILQVINSHNILFAN